jgi:hypothetical protein
MARTKSLKNIAMEGMKDSCLTSATFYRASGKGMEIVEYRKGKFVEKLEEWKPEIIGDKETENKQGKEQNNLPLQGVIFLGNEPVEFYGSVKAWQVLKGQG